MSVRCYLGLGSNMGDRLLHLKTAVKLLDAVSGIQCISRSRIYETDPVGYLEQDQFLNAVVCVRTTRKPFELLELILQIEKQMGRERLIHWGPRTIDIDILTYGNMTLLSEQLVLPHPRLHERAFVLLPFMDLDKQWVHPNMNQSIQELWNQLKQKGGVREWMIQWESEYERTEN
ncbi:2-amino-4-hydroxy-6-hydroxymethyldihydropteridine diphosphokinase [Fodinisporobacter ferrooxydans]|uniref:2-amino-4-hydroxy-6-hydroxymethyldihydropteridine diphosphokinase n=1 Tax=Fodinisporobacter ferrooxydans TaxID=2901836 RepID=A0ABY4CVE4_9BACL|nr:2-amino-4-hydroxy-6-hydroxymethyldihydropteridine diphosphokinase [Alicyclobacillaceae bacterium MYW30-H2]